MSTRTQAERICRGAAISEQVVKEMFVQAEAFARELLKAI
jgi:hypothetical protein